jgi:hypothetical protein
MAVIAPYRNLPYSHCIAAKHEKRSTDMTEFDKMSKRELESKLLELKDLLEEVIEERSIILGQENIHLSSKLVTKYANEIQDIKDKIAAIENLLKA